MFDYSRDPDEEFKQFEEKARKNFKKVLAAGCGMYAILGLIGLGILGVAVWAIITVVLHFTS